MHFLYVNTIYCKCSTFAHLLTHSPLLGGLKCTFVTCVCERDIKILHFVSDCWSHRHSIAMYDVTSMKKNLLSVDTSNLAMPFYYVAQFGFQDFLINIDITICLLLHETYLSLFVHVKRKPFNVIILEPTIFVHIGRIMFFILLHRTIKRDYNKRLITFTVITLSDVHCTKWNTKMVRHYYRAFLRT